MAGNSYHLTVPLDLSDIDDKHADDRVKVVAQAADQTIVSTISTVAELEADPAQLEFEAHPGTVRIAVGPAEAEDRQLLEGDTVHKLVPSRLWDDISRVDIAPIKIGPWYWGRWKRWCRTITVTGRLICPDGRPVPGATVCAYDIDWWFIWSSKQLAGCTTTAADGSFTLTFTWCCGLYPWWWWFQTRPWILDDDLAQLVQRHLGADLRYRLDAPTTLPSLSVFQSLLDRKRGLLGERPILLSDLDPEKVESARQSLVNVLPAAPELEKLQIWPWAPWAPWRDCSPDLVFSATQDCGEGRTVVLSEGPAQTRWDVPDQLSVTLVANEKACCRPEGGDDDCLIVDEVCSHAMHHVAGNLGAPGAPAAVNGYLITNTDGFDQELDIPFGGSVPVYQNPSDLVGVDYYALEHSTDGGVTWLPLPAGASPAFVRRWMVFTPMFGTGQESFTPTVVGAYHVYETRRHFQDNHYGDWDPVGDRFWLSTNYDLLSAIDSTTLVDGVHHFRVVQFTETAPGEFKGPETVLGCDRETPASFVLAIDNRVISPIGHDPSHNCGAGVHTCTTEPDTHILAVRVDGVEVGPCDTIKQSDGEVEIDFLVTDPDGHLLSYGLSSHYGTSGYVDLTTIGSVTCLSGGPDARSYAEALALGATRPFWTGGKFRLTVPAHEAFPVPCCYLLRLEAYKRTLESCVQDVRNVSEMTLGIGV
jgi:hypothetical protein